MAFRVIREKREAARNKKLMEIFMVTWSIRIVIHLLLTILMIIITIVIITIIIITSIIITIIIIIMQERGDPEGERISLDQMREVFRMYEVDIIIITMYEIDNRHHHHHRHV